MADNNPFDQATRYVARMDPPGILAWALRCSASDFLFVRWLDTRSVPFPGTSDRISDLVAQLERNEPPGQPWLIPIEFQVDPDPLMFGRLLEYLGRLWRSERPTQERGDRFWLGAAVVNLTGFGSASLDCEWSEAGPRVLLRVSERNVGQESAEQTLADIANGLRSPVILTFIPLMEGGTEPGIIEEWKRLALIEPESRRRSDLGALAIVLAEASGRKEI
jgi:hypothetical protein